MNRLLKTPFFFICAGVLLICTQTFAVVTTKISPTKNINPSSTKTWYGASSSSPIALASTSIKTTAKTWTQSLSITANNIDFCCAMDVSPSGVMYISYYSVNYGGLMYQRGEKGGKGLDWSSSTVIDSTLGGTSSIALAYEFTPSVPSVVPIMSIVPIKSVIPIKPETIHVAYNDTVNNELKYAVKEPGKRWRVETLLAGSWNPFGDISYAIDEFGDVGIAVDGDGHVHIICQADSSILYLTNESGSWSQEQAYFYGYAGSDFSPNLVLDSSRQPHISYVTAGSKLKYLTKSSGSWTEEQIDYSIYGSNVSTSMGLIIDQNDHSYVSYTAYDRDTSSDTYGYPQLRYATNKSGSWEKTTIVSKVDKAYASSLALDSSNKVHLIYGDGYAFQSPQLTWAMSTSSSSGWNTSDTDHRVNKNAIMKMDSSDHIYVIHWDSSLDCWTTYSGDYDSDGTKNSSDTDDDGDGTLDAEDPFPYDATETLDTDGDGIGNNADTDDDGDTVLDADDAFPEDASENTDSDSDGIGDNSETDDDNDGVLDADDALPNDSSETLDTDDDGIGNNADTDDDDDGFLDDVDPNPTTFDADTDHDGIPDSTDDDDDGDGISDDEDTDDDGDDILDTDEDIPTSGRSQKIWMTSVLVNGRWLAQQIERQNGFAYKKSKQEAIHETGYIFYCN